MYRYLNEWQVNELCDTGHGWAKYQIHLGHLCATGSQWCNMTSQSQVAPSPFVFTWKPAFGAFPFNRHFKKEQAERGKFPVMEIFSFRCLMVLYLHCSILNTFCMVWWCVAQQIIDLCPEGGGFESVGQQSDPITWTRPLTSLGCYLNTIFPHLYCMSFWAKYPLNK